MGEAFLGLLALEQEEHGLLHVRLLLYMIWPHAGKGMLPTEQESFLWNFEANCLNMNISLVVGAGVIATQTSLRGATLNFINK